MIGGDVLTRGNPLACTGGVIGGDHRGGDDGLPGPDGSKMRAAPPSSFAVPLVPISERPIA